MAVIFSRIIVQILIGIVGTIIQAGAIIILILVKKVIGLGEDEELAIMNTRIKTICLQILKGIRTILIFLGSIGIIIIQFKGFLAATKELDELSQYGFIDKIIGWLIFIGIFFAYYYFLKEILKKYEQPS